MKDFAYVLKCERCGKEEFLGLTQAVRRLTSVGMLRREKEPSIELILELLKSALPAMPCRSCDATGMALEEDPAWDDDTCGGKPCQQCGTRIDPERLEVFPDAVLCVACQLGEDQGETVDEVDYCPKCGGPMEVKKSSRGITRYRMHCPSCRQ